MPESGQIKHLGHDSVRVWISYWQGRPPVLCTGSVLLPADRFAGLPSGTMVDVQALQRGEVVVVRRPAEQTSLDDQTFEALLREAEVGSKDG